MTEHQVIGNAVLYCCDARDITDLLKGYVDAVVTDPPYGIDYRIGDSGHGHSLRLKKPIYGDAEPFDPAWILDFVYRSGMDIPLLLWGADCYKERLPQGGTMLCWDKSCGQGAANSFIDAEFAWMNRRNARCIYRLFWKGATRSGEGKAERKFHPSQKPVELMRWCLETARIGIGKAVLDPYMGSGTTGLACVTTGRKFIGVEIDREYFDIACRRIEQAQQQATLFDEWELENDSLAA